MSSDGICFTSNHYYTQKDKIGTGASCEVYRGVQKATCQVHALKIFKNKSWEGSYEHRREVEALKTLKHQHIVGFYGREEAYPSGMTVLVMEYCRGGSLHSILQEPENINGLEDGEFLTFLKHICSGLKHLRSQGFVHRDIKPGNVLRDIRPDGSVVYKISDFGASKSVGSEEGEFMSLAGTEEYLHPALYEKAFVNRFVPTVFKSFVDLWSLGCTIYHACVGEIPFKPYGGVRKNRDIMYTMITCKPRGCIAGSQLTAGSDVMWRRDLPHTCRMSESLRLLIQRVISGLVEADQARQWTFQTFEEEVARIIKMRKLCILNTMDSSMSYIYCQPKCSLQELQEAIGRHAEVSASSQLLFHRGQNLEDLFKANNKVDNSFEADREDPIILISLQDTDYHRLSNHSLEPYSSFASSTSLEDDVHVALKGCQTIFKLCCQVHQSCLAQRGIRNAGECLVASLREKFSLIEKKFKIISETCREKGLRMDIMGEYESQRTNLLKTCNSSIRYRHSMAKATCRTLSQTLWKLKKTLTELKTAIHCSETLGRAGVTVHADNDTSSSSPQRMTNILDEAKSIWRNMKQRKRLIHLSDFEDQLHRKEKKDLQELCARAVSLWQDQCLPETKEVFQVFWKQKSLCLDRVAALKKAEKTLMDARDGSEHLTQILSEMWAFSARAWKDVNVKIAELHEKPLQGRTSSSVKCLLENMEISKKRFDSLLKDLPDVERFDLEEV